MYAFEAILVRPSKRKIAPQGTSVPLCALLPKSAGTIPILLYEVLQSIYDDELEILNVQGRAIIIARICVRSAKELREAIEDFAERIQLHLGYLTTVI